MGIFYEQCIVVNRAPVTLTVRFDGQDMNLLPGENYLPKAAIEFAKNQNPIMGTQDPNNPHISGAQYLIGVVGIDSEEECTPLTEEEWTTHCGQPARLDSQLAFEEKYGHDPKARLVLHGKPPVRPGQEAPAAARNRADAAGVDLRKGNLADFARDAV